MTEPAKLPALVHDVLTLHGEFHTEQKSLNVLISSYVLASTEERVEAVMRNVDKGIDRHKLDPVRKLRRWMEHRCSRYDIGNLITAAVQMDAKIMVVPMQNGSAGVQLLYEGQKVGSIYSFANPTIIRTLAINYLILIAFLSIKNLT
jgi:hypothetical protein